MIKHSYIQNAGWGDGYCVYGAIRELLCFQCLVAGSKMSVQPVL